MYFTENFKYSKKNEDFRHFIVIRSFIKYTDIKKLAMFFSYLFTGKYK